MHLAPFSSHAALIAGKKSAAPKRTTFFTGPIETIANSSAVGGFPSASRQTKILRLEENCAVARQVVVATRADRLQGPIFPRPCRTAHIVCFVNSHNIPIKRHQLVRGQQACLCFKIHSPEEEGPAASCCGRQRRESRFCRRLVHVNHEVLPEDKIVILELPKLRGPNIPVCEGDTLPGIRNDRPLIVRPIEYPRLKLPRQIARGRTESIVRRVTRRIGDPKGI